MKTIAIAIALTVSAVTAVACSPAENGARPTTTTTSAGLLDGRSFQVRGALPDGGPLASDVSFAGGKFDSTACHAFGFTAGAYTVRREADVVTFRAEMRGQAGVETWAGRVVGKTIDGTVTGPDGVAIAFHGASL